MLIKEKKSVDFFSLRGYYTAMTNIPALNLAQRIKRRLQKLGKSERGASLEAGLSDSFLRNIRQKKSGSPRIDTLEKIAEVLETTPGWLMTGEGPEDLPGSAAEQVARQNLFAPLPPKTDAAPYDGFHESSAPYAPAGFSPYPPRNAPPCGPFTDAPPAPNAAIGGKFALSERRLPVYGQAVGGIDGEFPINGSTLYSVLCPPQLSEVSGAYAVAISGDSMYPRYEDGEIAFVDPTRRVKKGDYVIAQILSREGEPPLAYVKKFIRHNAGGLVLEQFNPQKELCFPHDRVVSVHYIALAGTAPN